MSFQSKRQQLWDILGKPEKKFFEFNNLANGKRIHGGTGSYWFGVNEDKDGRSEGEEDGEEEDPKDPSGGNDGDPRRDPTECPKIGESVPGLTGMTDCGTGRCVNVNFTMPPLPPAGWSGACEPPNVDNISIVYRLTISTSQGGVVTSVVLYFLTGAEMFAAASKEAAKAKSFSYKGQYGYVVEYNPQPQPASLSSNGSYFYSYSTSYDSAQHRMNSVLIQGWHYRCQQYPLYCQEATSQIKASWPPETCAEINSSAFGFIPACPEYDKNLPPQLQTETTAIELCTADGGKVTITRNGKGWKYTTASCTVTVNDSGIVTSVQKFR